MREWLYDVFRERPWWMSACMIFCAYMAFLYVPWDLFVKPVARDEEVWFGIELRGPLAKLGALAHWFVFGAAIYGFRRRRPWMAFWAPAYVAQIAFSIFVWTALEQGGLNGLVFGLLYALPMAGLAFAFWRSRDYFAPRPLGLVTRYGDWALVTGASSGIGAELARQIAADGMNVVLTARRGDRLARLAEDLEKESGVATRVVVADLSEREGQNAVLAGVDDLEIGLLVNNAGLGYQGRFDLQDGDRLRRLVALNCEAPLVLTHALAGRMCARGCGAVLFTGSAAGHQPLPLHAVYAATKAFDRILGESLWGELRAANIDVVVLEPGSTQTEFQAVAGELAHPGDSVEIVARTGLEALGQQPSVLVGWYNWLRANFASRFLTRPVAIHAAHAVMAAQTPEDMR
jgi:short-subunit dehydrogenase